MSTIPGVKTERRKTSQCLLTAEESSEVLVKIQKVEKALDILKYLAIYIAGVSTANSDVALAALKSLALTAGSG